ncbi:MAG: FitA-like ribbon-helix-helix domain-containing protein [Micropepsaceae bacterium]
MARITIVDLDETVLDALQGRAASAGISLEDEVRRILAASVHQDALKRLDAVRKSIGPLSGPSSLDDLWASRNKDDPTDAHGRFARSLGSATTGLSTDEIMALTRGCWGSD